MNSKALTYLSVLIIAVFIGYMVVDSSRKGKAPVPETTTALGEPQMWLISNELNITEGSLTAVTVSGDGKVFAGGDSFVSCYDQEMQKRQWTVNTGIPVTALTLMDDTIYAATNDHLIVLDNKGSIIGELGPWDDGSIITSVSAGLSTIAVADAGKKLIYLIDKGGEVVDIISDDIAEFVIPSPYFDVVNTEKSVFAANTGMKRIEERDFNGDIISYFGEAGLAPDAFCGCCNPAHFTSFGEGFVTAEKGINRIKIIDSIGRFVEFVSSENSFKPSVPLDIASFGTELIYAANPDDSKIYVFKRKKTE